MGKKKEVMKIDDYKYKELDRFISYGFRIKEEVPFSNADIKELFMKGAKIFKFIAEEAYDELKSYLKFHPSLNILLDKWIKWDTIRSQQLERGSVA